MFRSFVSGRMRPDEQLANGGPRLVQLIDHRHDAEAQCWDGASQDGFNPTSPLAYRHQCLSRPSVSLEFALNIESRHLVLSLRHKLQSPSPAMVEMVQVDVPQLVAHHESDR